MRFRAGATFLFPFLASVAFSGNTRAEDSAPAAPLLPSRLGPMESLLWSERGAMRRWFEFPLTQPGREREMRNRRVMLTLHQLGGFATLAAMAATVFLGQKVYDGEGDLSQMHKAMAYTTAAGYLTTASLAAFAPPPMIRRNEWSSISAHKLLGTVHFTGMLAMPVLGTLVANGRRDLALTHRLVGYTTLTAFGAAMLVVTF